MRQSCLEGRIGTFGNCGAASVLEGVFGEQRQVTVAGCAGKPSSIWLAWSGRGKAGSCGGWEGGGGCSSGVELGHWTWIEKPKCWKCRCALAWVQSLHSQSWPQGVCFAAYCLPSGFLDHWWHSTCLEIIPNYTSFEVHIVICTPPHPLSFVFSVFTPIAAFSSPLQLF